MRLQEFPTQPYIKLRRHFAHEERQGSRQSSAVEDNPSLEAAETPVSPSGAAVSRDSSRTSTAGSCIQAALGLSSQARLGSCSQADRSLAVVGSFSQAELESCRRAELASLRAALLRRQHCSYEFVAS